MIENNKIADLDNKIIDLQTNIIKWYNFEENENSLIVGKNSETISNYLSSKLKNVVAVDDLDENQNSIKFKYIILLNCISFENSEEKNLRILKLANKILKNDGTIFLIVSNLFSIKFLSELNYNNYNIEGITKFDLENLLNKADFKNYKFYYPLPSNINANVIFSDELLPNKISLDRNIDLKKEKEYRNFNYKKILEQVLENNKNNFKYLSDSYLIEISNNLKENVRAIYFNNVRKKEFQLTTKILEKNVYKICDEYSKNHLNSIAENIKLLKDLNISTLDSFDGEKIISKYVHNGVTLQDIFLSSYKKGNQNEINEIVEKFKNDILYKLKITDSKNNVFEKYNISISNEKINSLTFVKYGLFDLTMQNIFVINDEFWVYDQEWLEENIPIEFILYRSILYTSKFNSVEKEKLYKQFNLSEYVEEFFSLENKIQEKLLDKDIFNCHLNSENSYKEIFEILKEKDSEILKIKRESDNKILMLKNENDNKILELKKKNLDEIENLINKNKENEKSLILKNKMLENEIIRITQEKDLYIDLVNKKEELLIEKEKKLLELKNNCGILKVTKMKNAVGRIYKKIRGI